MVPLATDDTGKSTHKVYRTGRRLDPGRFEMDYDDHYVEVLSNLAPSEDPHRGLETPFSNTDDFGRPIRTGEDVTKGPFEDESQRKEGSSSNATNESLDAVARAARVEDMFRYQCARYTRERDARRLSRDES